MHYLEKVVFNFLLFSVVQTNAAESCNTVSDEPGQCISLKSCPSLLEMLSNKPATSIDKFKDLICGFEGTDPKVCCILPLNSRHQVNKNQQKAINRQLLSDRRYCGYQHSDGYEHSRNATTISEFPWLARIVYGKRTENPVSYQKKYLCLGSVITVRYILTATTCVVQPEYVPMEVQLGEYHLANDTDCVTDASNVKECSDPTKSYEIEKIVAHSNYNNVNYINDIALIRLNCDVEFTDYIRPICLPYPGTKFADIGNTLTTSGWGYINIQGDEAIIKKRVLGTLISNVECMEAYKIVKWLNLTEKHVCTLPLKNSMELSCRGDAGAPVIFKKKLQWHQEGIVSFGEGRCGSKFPEVHTRVQEYLDWIEENIEPY